MEGDSNMRRLAEVEVEVPHGLPAADKVICVRLHFGRCAHRVKAVEFQRAPQFGRCIDIGL